MDTKDWIVSAAAVLTAIANIIAVIHKIATDKKKTAKRVKPRKLIRKR